MLSKYFLQITRPRGVQGAGSHLRHTAGPGGWVLVREGGDSAVSSCSFCGPFQVMHTCCYPPPRLTTHITQLWASIHACTHACMPHPTPPSLGHCRRRASPTPPHPTLKNTRTLPPNTPRRWQASWWRQRSERAVIAAHPPPPPPLLACARAPTFLASPTTSLCCCRWPASWGQPYHHTHKHARTRMLTKYHSHPLRRRWPASWWRRRATGA